MEDVKFVVSAEVVSANEVGVSRTEQIESDEAFEKQEEEVVSAPVEHDASVEPTNCEESAQKENS